MDRQRKQDPQKERQLEPELVGVSVRKLRAAIGGRVPLGRLFRLEKGSVLRRRDTGGQ